MKPFSRSDRVGGLIQRELSNLLQKNVSDPRLEGTIITGVKMSRDLRIAKIYFTSHGGKTQSQATAEGFKSALGYVKRHLADKLGLRYMPALQFYYDESFDYGANIDKLLQTAKKQAVK
ncbi:MAG: 30S ribosome-binding factor RbfA [Deltaproteobacteria bacterium]|nr:30S ribosome-binding factor RbfA [Deltaproteobacteria bacterium]